MVTGPPRPHHELRGPGTLNLQSTGQNCLLPLFTPGSDTAQCLSRLCGGLETALGLPLSPVMAGVPYEAGQGLTVNFLQRHSCAWRMPLGLMCIPALSCNLSGVEDGASLCRAGSSGPFFSTFLLMNLCSRHPRRMCGDSGLFQDRVMCWWALPPSLPFCETVRGWQDY